MSRVCFRCGEESYTDSLVCEHCGEQAVVDVNELIDLVNDMYIHKEVVVQSDGEVNYLSRVTIEGLL